MKNQWKILIPIIFPVLLTIVACTKTNDTKMITIGTTSGDFTVLANEGLKPELEKKGYKVKVVEFTDYMTPNIALAEGKIDLNIFQHKPYLDQFIKEKGLQLSPLAQVPTAPLGLYSGKLKSINEVKNNSSIAMPNDPTNLSRALNILADLGWIEVNKDVNPLLVGIKDIIKNPKNLKIIPLEAAQVPRAAQDVDFAIINGNYATSAGISLNSVLTQEKSNTFINWIVVTHHNLNSDFAKDIITITNTDAFKKYAKAKFKGYKYPEIWTKK